MQPEHELALYLDENLHNCRPILDALAQAGIHYERHGDHFPEPGIEDAVWLPYIGARGWILVTKDKGIRYNELERRALVRSGIREFCFSSGNMSAAEMSDALLKAIPAIRKMCARIEGPFIASITKSGLVHVRYDKEGSVHTRTRRRK